MKIANSFQREEGSENNHESEEKSKIADGSLENGQVTQFYFKTLIELQLALSLLVIINLYLIIVSASQSFPAILPQNQITINTCLYFSILCVIISIIILAMRSLTVLQLEKEQKRIYQKATLFSTKKFLHLLLESAALLIQPYPFLNYVNFSTSNAYDGYTIFFPVNDLLTIFSFIRIYIVFRSALELTPYMNNRSNRLCKMYGCRADFSFSLKCLFRDNPLTLICLLFASSAVIFAYLIYIAQRQLQAQNNGYSQRYCNNFLNSLWLILITVTTVGYGDYYPKTPLGRIIILFVAIWGTFIVSIMVVVVSNTLNMEKSQLRTSKILNKLYLREEIKERARCFIGYFIILKLKKLHNQEEERMLKLFMSSKKEFIQKKREIKEITQYDDIQDEVASHFLKLNNDIDTLNNNQNSIIEFIHQNFNYKSDSSQQKQECNPDLADHQQQAQQQCILTINNQQQGISQPNIAFQQQQQVEQKQQNDQIFMRNFRNKISELSDKMPVK